MRLHEEYARPVAGVNGKSTPLGKNCWPKVRAVMKRPNATAVAGRTFGIVFAILFP
jgi:hypothetical protein